jgi:hypothetical protein
MNQFANCENRESPIDNRQSNIDNSPPKTRRLPGAGAGGDLKFEISDSKWKKTGLHAEISNRLSPITNRQSTIGNSLTLQGSAN